MNTTQHPDYVFSPYTNDRQRPEITVSGGRCEACNKILSDSEQRQRGYASGQELGLCAKCAVNVNNREAMKQPLPGGELWTRLLQA